MRDSSKVEISQLLHARKKVPQQRHSSPLLLRFAGVDSKIGEWSTLRIGLGLGAFADPLERG
jgi:hypothetical protein